LLALAVLPVFSINPVSRVHADLPFSLNAAPPFTWEGTIVSLDLYATGVVSNIQYRFRFSVTDPSGKTAQSLTQNATAPPGQSWFKLSVLYPSPALQGSNTLVGQYSAKVDELFPTAAASVAGTSFIISITNSSSYQRTDTISIRASGYNGSESVTVAIRTQTSSTLVFSALIAATITGLVTTSWKIPRNATIDNYVVTLTGTSTFKNPADRQTVSVRQAIMNIVSITSFKTSYQRTETMGFFFPPPIYPDGSVSTTGVGLVTLARIGGGSVSLPATYDSPSQTFEAFYQTSLDNQTGTWTASLGSHAYNDGSGNNGPGTIVSTSPQLTTIPLTVTVTTNSTIALGQQLKFNATVTYFDGGVFQGTVKAYLVYSGTPAINDTVPVVFDTSLKAWFGTYTIRPSDTGGLWSLVVKASDSPTPPNTGSASRVVTVQNTTGNASFPLYYFGIIAALLALLLVAMVFAFRRRKVTHARLKIDLDAVRSEAGRIESTDFFKSVKDQVKKEKDDK
jgi:hypothetical protein